jgi:hypothetical protein
MCRRFCVVLSFIGRDLVMGQSFVQGVLPKMSKRFHSSRSEFWIGTGERAWSVKAEKWESLDHQLHPPTPTHTHTHTHTHTPLRLYGVVFRQTRDLPIYFLLSLFPVPLVFFFLGARIAQWYSAGLRAGWSGVRVPVRAENVSLHRASRTALEPTHPPIQWIRAALSLGLKWLGCEADHSPPSN